MPPTDQAPTICPVSVQCVLHTLFLNVTTILQIAILSIFMDKVKVTLRLEEVKQLVQGHKLG